jgi:hypothetical protein
VTEKGKALDVHGVEGRKVVHLPAEEGQLSNPTAQTSQSPSPPEAKRFGSWTLLSIDALGKRALCRCACGAVREVNKLALETGVTRSCGRLPYEARPAPQPPPTFAGEAAMLAARASRKRHKGGVTCHERADLPPVHRRRSIAPKTRTSRGAIA